MVTVRSAPCVTEVDEKDRVALGVDPAGGALTATLDAPPTAVSLRSLSLNVPENVYVPGDLDAVTA